MRDVAIGFRMSEDDASRRLNRLLDKMGAKSHQEAI